MKPPPLDGTLCDHCGRWFTWFEFAETIEEHLCEECASGIGDDDEFDSGELQDDHDWIR